METTTATTDNSINQSLSCLDLLHLGSISFNGNKRGVGLLYSGLQLATASPALRSLTTYNKTLGTIRMTDEKARLETL